MLSSFLLNRFMLHVPLLLMIMLLLLVVVVDSGRHPAIGIVYYLHSLMLVIVLLLLNQLPFHVFILLLLGVKIQSEELLVLTFQIPDLLTGEL